MKPKNIDEYYISRTLGLAKKAQGFTSPNPLVGSVIVKNGVIVGEGYHKKAGEPHAEINALTMAGEDARGATLYVNLEPCSHFGKTPPCVESIKKYGIKKVVSAMQDPNPLVAGKGFRYLEENGIEVIYGVSEDKAKRLNEIFLHFITTGLPFITIKEAISIDGKIGYLAYNQKNNQNYNHNNIGNSNVGDDDRIINSDIKDKDEGEDKDKLYLSSEKSLRYVHYLRFIHDAILVSVKTVINDNPLLNIRRNNFKKKENAKIILDSNLLTPINSKLFETKGQVIIFTSIYFDDLKQKRYELLKQKGAIIKEVYYNEKYLDLKGVFKECAKMGITSILIEAGKELFGYSLMNNLFNKLIFNITPHILGNYNTIDVFGSIMFNCNNKNNNDLNIDINRRINESSYIRCSKNNNKSKIIQYNFKEMPDNSMNLHNLEIKRLGDNVFLTYYPMNH